MATQNKAVSVYLPPKLEEYLTQYCTQHGITRQLKSGEIQPALGTGIVEILEQYFTGLVQDSKGEAPSLSDKTDLKGLLEALRPELEQMIDARVAQLLGGANGLEELFVKPSKKSY